jgi:hypothetical protein
MIKLGRNDPCHCGSGKKYKKCHLDKDQRHARIQPVATSSDTPSAQDTPPVRLDLKKLPERLRQISKDGPDQGRAEFEELIATTAPLFEYVERQAEIEAAGAELEAHRKEFKELADDWKRCHAFAEKLFAEQCFAPLRFTAEDVRRAFDHVGYPGVLSPDDKAAETLRAAILHIADKERRSALSIQLLLELPEFVATKRYLEGWLVQIAALETAEAHDESNEFLFQMFSYGYDAFTAEKQAQDEALLKEVGVDLDRLRKMSRDELDAWLAAQTADSAKGVALESFFSKHPHLQKEAVANLDAMERNSTKLLEREDSHVLHLPGEELGPWITRLNERLSESDFQPDQMTDSAAKARAGKIFEEQIFPVVREMADTIFTPVRIQNLGADLRKYRNERLDDGDTKTAEYANGAITSLREKHQPGQNPFLVTLCWKSVLSLQKATPKETEMETSEDSDE